MLDNVTWGAPYREFPHKDTLGRARRREAIDIEAEDAHLQSHATPQVGQSSDIDEIMTRAQTEDCMVSDFEAMHARDKEKKRVFAEEWNKKSAAPVPSAQKIIKEKNGERQMLYRRKTFHGFCKHMRDHSTDHRIIPPLCSGQDRPGEIVAKYVINRQKCYIVKWADTYML